MNEPQSIADLYLSKWAPTSDTYKTMRGALRTLAHVLGYEGVYEAVEWHKLRYETVRAIPAKLTTRKLKPRTINKCLSALRGVLEVAWRTGKISDEEYRHIKIENVRGNSRPAGRGDVDVGEAVAALAKVTPRDAALLAVLFACGLRRVEVVRLRVEDYDASSGKIIAHGKGDKPRFVPLSEGWRPIVLAWWKARPRGSLVFVDESGGALTRKQVSGVVTRFCRNAGVERFTPHDLRRTFATSFLQNGGDVAALSRLLGHASIQTTVGSYDRRTDEEAEAILRKMPAPKID